MTREKNNKGNGERITNAEGNKIMEEIRNGGGKERVLYEVRVKRESRMKELRKQEPLVIAMCETI